MGTIRGKPASTRNISNFLLLFVFMFIVYSFLYIITKMCHISVASGCFEISSSCVNRNSGCPEKMPLFINHGILSGLPKYRHYSSEVFRLLFKKSRLYHSRPSEHWHQVLSLNFSICGVWAPYLSHVSVKAWLKNVKECIKIIVIVMSTRVKYNLIHNPQLL